jgi:hypothetical protein
MSTSANGDTFTLPQYGGMVIEGVPAVTPFLSLVSRTSGGLMLPGGGIINTDGLKIGWENAPERGVTNQAGVVEGGTPTSRNNINTQEYNVLQIFQEGFELTYSANSTGTLQSGSAATLINATGIGAMPTRKTKQVSSAIFALQKAINYQMHRGTRSMPANNSSARVMGGSATLAGWTKDCETAALTDSLLKNFLRDGWLTYGALRGAGPYVCFCDSYFKDYIFTLYGTNRILPSSTIANIKVDVIDTSYGQIAFVLDPDMHTYSGEIIDLSEWALYGMPTIDPATGGSKGIFFLEEMARTAAKQQWQIYGEISTMFGHANHIGRIYNVGGTSA